MRFFKSFLIVFITLLIILTITYSARIPVINNLAKTQLSLAEIKVTCFDISLARNLAIIVDKLCLHSPKADIEILDITIKWQYSPDIKITDIDVSLATIKGTDHLLSNTTHALKSNNQNLSQILSTTLSSYTKTISKFQLPVNITIAEISYLPFTIINKAKVSRKTGQQQRKIAYTANLSAVDSNFSFSLLSDEKKEVMKTKLTKSEKDFSIAFSSNLNLLKSFTSAHQLPITAAFQHALSTSEISGSFDSVISYQANALSMQNRITDIVIGFNNDSDESETLKLTGSLNFQSHLNLMPKEKANKGKNQAPDKSEANIALTFVGENELSLAYNQAQLFTLLEKNKVLAAIISILENNPLEYLKLKLKNNAVLTLNDEKLQLSHIEINTHGDERAHHVTLEDLALTLPDSSLSIKSFIIDSQVKLANIAKFTNSPVVLHLEGSLQKNETSTKLNLTESSSITANNIVVVKPPSNANKNTTAMASDVKGAKKYLSLKTLSTRLEGSVQRLENKVTTLNLKAQSQASNVNVPEILQINSFDLSSHIKGNLDDININAIASADTVNLGSIVITGTTTSPKVQIDANKLQLTDLLSLNMQLPTDIELIDGKLDYSVSGQITELSDTINTPFNVSIAVTSASGTVDDIWLQELNWQQDFTILAGKITTKANTKENLTIEYIETPTPISKLSINTNWILDESFKFSANNLKADILGGSVSIPKIKWPLEHGHSVNVQLNSVDLEQVLALDEKQGIVVTGYISGQIPVKYDGEKYIIEDGELHNISNGVIQVTDNPAVADLKASNSQLQLAFDALQNLHYHQLSSAVSMADDGYMLLETVIKGRNPDIDNDVNLNLNLSYDLPGLLESLSITQRFEKSIIKSLQNN